MKQFLTYSKGRNLVLIAMAIETGNVRAGIFVAAATVLHCARCWVQWGK